MCGGVEGGGGQLTLSIHPSSPTLPHLRPCLPQGTVQGATERLSRRPAGPPSTPSLSPVLHPPSCVPAGRSRGPTFGPIEAAVDPALLGGAASPGPSGYLRLGPNRPSQQRAHLCGRQASGYFACGSSPSRGHPSGAEPQSPSGRRGRAPPGSRWARPSCRAFGCPSACRRPAKAGDALAIARRSLPDRLGASHPRPALRSGPDLRSAD